MSIICAQPVETILGKWPVSAWHALTMTGELADVFPHRADGVEALVSFMAERVGEERLRIYAAGARWLSCEDVSEHWASIASANWLASASWVASRTPHGLFIDIGSTTTDIIGFADGAVHYRGETDGERLQQGELLYTGVVRTPVCAVIGAVPFRGAWQPLASEVFATMADVYRLTEELPQGADQMPSADGRDKSQGASAARLARMLGRDSDAANLEEWRQVAAHVARAQRQAIHDALDRTISRGKVSARAPIIGAGVGRFVAAEIARAAGRPYEDAASMFALSAGMSAAAAADCAPAAALALLACRTP